jgi:hypothetical protein
MTIEALIDPRREASKRLVTDLLARRAPLLASYWEFREEVDRWTLILVPESPETERDLLTKAVDLMVQPPYRTAFSISDPSVDSRQMSRAKALGAYIRMDPYVGRRIDTTFTGGEYFDSVVPVYFKPDIMTHLSAV